MDTSGAVKKILCVRLSSLGDVVLSTAALESQALAGKEIHFLTGIENQDWLRGHPRIHTLWTFDKNLGFQGWVSLWRKLDEEGFEVIYDLHQSLRTRAAHLLLKSLGSQARWVSLSKPYVQRVGLFTLKRYWPGKITPWREAFAKLTGGSGEEKPNFKYLIGTTLPAWPEISKPRLAVMPSSKWLSKTWPTANYVKLIRTLTPEFEVVIFGTAQDSASRELCRQLDSYSIPHRKGVGRWNVRETVQALSRCERLLSGDTGLVHVAESIGVPVTVLFGPTQPSLGFAPFLEKSRSVTRNLGCSPCSKDGRHCYRLGDPYACLMKLEPEQVKEALR